MTCKREQSRYSFPEKASVPYAGRVYDEKEIIALVDASLDFWLTTGRYAEQFEKDLAEFLGMKYLPSDKFRIFCKSSCGFCSHLTQTRREQVGTLEMKLLPLACGFPTTLNPIIQNNLVPVFVDVEPGTYNIQVDQIEDAISERTKAIIIPHTLGNPADLTSDFRTGEKI